METTEHLESQKFMIGDDDFRVQLCVEINHRTSVLTYLIRTGAGYEGFKFQNSKPETVRKIASLITAATNKVTKLCEEHSVQIKGVSYGSSCSSNGAQADAASAKTGGL